MYFDKIKQVAPRELSLAVVGLDYPNADGSNRRFEMLICERGEPVTFLPEPKNKFDQRAVAVLSSRGVQLGYLTAERAWLVQPWLQAGDPYEAVFHEPSRTAAIIRVRFGGGKVELPADRPDVVYDCREMVYGEFVDWGC